MNQSFTKIIYFMIPWFGSIKMLYKISNSQINYEKQTKNSTGILLFKFIVFVKRSWSSNTLCFKDSVPVRKLHKILNKARRVGSGV